MPASDIGFAVVGLGMGANRAREVVATPGARLVAVCDIDEARLDRVVAEHGCEGTPDYGDLLGRQDIDAIYVMTPSGLHAKVAIDAARAGKHVITTKPIETTLERADAMIAACEQAGVKLLVDFGNRYNAETNRIKAALDRGLFGRVILAEARLKWYRSQAYYSESWQAWHGTWELDGGGSLINQTVHYVDLLCWFMGPPETVRGRIGVYNHDIESEDMSLAMLHYPNGAEGVIVSTTTFPQNLPAGIEIHGIRGGVVYRKGEIAFWKTDGDAQVEAPVCPACAADDMVRALRDDQPLWCGGYEGRKSLSLIRAVYESALNGEKLVSFAGW
jgi:UDP-N-acetyl-2-amino-2-deoxyglucuronate dehydrogenase